MSTGYQSAESVATTVPVRPSIRTTVPSCRAAHTLPKPVAIEATQPVIRGMIGEIRRVAGSTRTMRPSQKPTHTEP